MPFDISGDGAYYGATGAVQLCYQCFFNYAPLRNLVNLLVDFSISDLQVNTPNKRVRTFIKTWLESIEVNQFMTRFFLEYYRSGNVFIYKFSGKISEDGMNMLKTAYSSDMRAESEGGRETRAAGRKSKTVPIRYIILNPMQVYLQRGASYAYGYVRMLSTYEIQRLKNPQTEEDKQVFESFPEDIQRQIMQGGAWRYIYVPLDQTRLYYVFYRKADYEPLAIPMAFPVMNDIEFKLQLRRMDMTLASTMEQVILLVTAGRAADQWNQVPSARQLSALQSIFQSQTIGRVLVADYTTKAEWVIPDLKELLGPAKYERVDKDIKEGLQYMFFGEESKFANASIKVKIFIESLKEGRRAFLENFLIPEVKKVCEQMNFRDEPTVSFEPIQIQDEAMLTRLYVQMGQLGLLTADEVNTAIETGVLPTKDESLVNQEEYKKARDKGLYSPLAPESGDEGEGGGGKGSVGKGRPAGTGGTPAPRKVTTPIGQKQVRTASWDGTEPDIVRPGDGKYHFGMVRVAESLAEMNALRVGVESALVKKWKVEGELTDAQQQVAASIAQSIVFNEPDATKWKKAVTSYIKAPKELPKDVLAEIAEIRATFDTPEHPVDSWTASVLMRSKVDFEPKG
jgi:hypothetical protein